MDVRRLYGAIVSGDMSLFVSKFNKLQYTNKLELVYFAIQLNQLNFLHYMLKHITIKLDELLIFSWQANQYDVAKYLITLGCWEEDDYLPHLLHIAVQKDKKDWVFLFLEYKVVCSIDILKEIEKKWGEEERFQLILYRKEVEDMEYMLFNIIEGKNEDFEEYEKMYVYTIFPFLFQFDKLKKYKKLY